MSRSLWDLAGNFHICVFLQVPRLAPEQAVTLPAQPASPEASGNAPSSPGPPGARQGLLGALLPSISAESSSPDAASPAEEASPGLLQRARNLKPLDAIGRAAERLPGIPSGAPRETAVAVEADVRSEEDDPGSRAASVRDRLGKLVPDRLRRTIDVGTSEEGELADGPVRLGPETRTELLREGEAKAEDALRKLKSKVGEAKEGLTGEDSAARRLGEKLRGTVGPGAGTAGTALGGQAPRSTVVCEDDAAAAVARSEATHEAAAKGLRGLVGRLRGATQVEPGGAVERDAQGPHQGCSDVPAEAAAAAGAPGESSAVSAEVRGADGSPALPMGDKSAAVMDIGHLSLLAMIHSWLTLW